jgi:hypothetical protein
MPTRNVARTITFRIPLGNLHVTERLIAFYMPWRGCHTCYWIVPLSYVESMKPVGTRFMRVKITQAYFDTPTGNSGWQREWERHISQ